MDRHEEFATLRKGMGLSRRRLAELLDRSEFWVRNIEQGQQPCPRYAILALRRLQEHPEERE